MKNYTNVSVDMNKNKNVFAALYS